MHYSDIIIDLKNNLNINLKDNLIDVILFGSQITERANKNSDYDILIITNKDVDWKLEKYISDSCYDIELKYGIFIDVHILSKKEINMPRGQQPIFESAIKNGIYA